MKIYTRTGDQGSTSLFTGERISKNDPFINALGAVDEANSTLGIALAFLPKEEGLQQTRIQLESIQHALFDVGAALATPLSKASQKKLDKTHFDEHAAALLEEWIDEMEKHLPPLQTFILPSGHPAGAFLHQARSLVRNAERKVVPLFQQGDVQTPVLIYLNRLSDYLFVTSRFVNHLLQAPETSWKPAS
jgi:cob(I)alamin adenosyltransferase